MVARHSPRVRAMETADHFMKGFEAEAARHGIEMKFMHGAGGEVRLTPRRQLESISETSITAGKKKAGSRDELEAAFAALNEGRESEFLLSRTEMLKPGRMGYILTHDKLFAKLAQRLAARGKKSGSGHAAGEAAQAHNEEPSVVSIFLRHSKNDGDKLTDEGKALAEKQGKALAAHLTRYVFSKAKGAVRPTIILHVSHGGGQTPGQLDWTFEEALGKDVKALRGQVMQAEGVVKLGYGNGEVRNLYLRQEGVMHFN